MNKLIRKIFKIDGDSEFILETVDGEMSKFGLAGKERAGLIPNHIPWQDFPHAVIYSGSGNLTLHNFRYSRIGDTVFVQGDISAGAGGGSDGSDEVRLLLPYPYATTSFLTILGVATLRRSGAALGNRTVGVITGTTGYGFRFFKPDGGIWRSEDMTTTNGEMGFTLVYEAHPTAPLYTGVP